MSLPSKSSSAADGISNNALKKIIQYILKDLTLCINKSIDEGIFPHRLKQAKITPIFKKNDRNNPNNWRPISQLLTFSKIFEKLPMDQINQQLNEQHILDDNQFGFRKNHSTLHPLLIVKNFIETELNQGKNIILLSLDLSKAFDVHSKH